MSMSRKCFQETNESLWRMLEKRKYQRLWQSGAKYKERKGFKNTQKYMSTNHLLPQNVSCHHAALKHLTLFVSTCDFVPTIK